MQQNTNKQADQKNPQANLNQDKVIHISFAYLILTTAYNPSLNFASKIIKDFGYENLGFYSVALLYLASSISSLLAPGFVNKFGIIKSFIIGSLLYPLCILSFILPASASERPSYSYQSIFFSKYFIWTLIIITSILNGMGAGLLWVA